ncbi:MAG TPA: shikimate kinase [Bacteroidia bacterium]|nr:shikimate kinase [Bacteroidia bacterium]
MKRHLAIAGFMGSGKTTLAKQISESSGVPYVDLDDYIEQQEGKNIVEIFEVYGEDKFRELETLYLKKILSIEKSTIIALGGGTVCFNDNLNFIKQNAWLITIMVNSETLTERLWNEKDKRPLIKHFQSKEDLRQFIEQKLNERLSYYMQADWVLKM